MNLFDLARDDVATLAALHKDSFSPCWDGPAIAALLAGPGVFVHHLPGTGFVKTRVAADEAEILTIAVAPAARRLGHGARLLAAASQEAHARGAARLFLEVATANQAALALYRGFERAGMRKAYYAGDNGHDAWLMQVQLPLPPGRNIP